MAKDEIFSHFIPTKLFFGPGELKRLSSYPMPGKKALVVISAGTSMRRYGYLDRVRKYLADNGVETVVFDKILPNPVKEHVTEGARICRDEKCDFVVGLGGGSSIDSAKSIAIMALNGGDYWDYVSGGTGRGLPVAAGALPVVAIPTTAGTGTEADPWTVITNGREKIGFGNDSTFPVVSIVDPEIMTSVPAALTAYQGFDAFFHAAEGYIARIATPISDLYALKSISLLAKSLPKAVANGSDIAARSDVALASMLSGMVESTSGCTSEHSLEHAMSGFHPQLPHGAGLIAISLAYFSRFADVCPQRFKDMAEAMTGTKAESPYDFIIALEYMQKACGVGDIKLSEWGVRPEEFSALVENARRTMGHLFRVDPEELSDDDVVDIYRRSYR